MMNNMNCNRSIEVPEALLKSQELLPSAKLIWIALLLDSSLEPKIRHSRTRLAAGTGLTRPTVYKALAALKASGWYSEDKPCNKRKLSGRTATVYVDLFLDTTLSIRTRLFHGLLQLTSGYREKTKQFKYLSLGKELDMCIKTVRKSVRQLVRNGWLAVTQVNQLAPILFNLRNPIKEQFMIMKARAERNLSEAPYKGEALMKEFLSLLVSKDDYIDNAKPDFLRNTETDKLMELDRYYPSIAAFEFNGNQHYASTDLYDEITVVKQRSRDILKKQLCTDRGIELVIIHPQDLTLSGMQRKIGSLLPLKSLKGRERLINFLERLSAGYRKNVPEMLPQV